VAPREDPSGGFRAVIAGLAVLFLGSRLLGLSALPIFLDEAIHLDWARRIASTGEIAGISDGSRHLPVLAYAFLAARAPFEEHLTLARAASAMTGLVTGLAILRFARRTSGTLEAGLAFAAAAVMPFHYVYDRMALADAWLTSAFMLTIVASYRLATKPTPRSGFLFGLCAGLALAAKLIGGLAFLLPAAWLGVQRADETRSSQGGVRDAVSPIAITLSVIAGASPAVALLALDAPAVARFALMFFWPLSPGTGPAAQPIANAAVAASWLADYWTPPGAILIALGAILAVRGNRSDERAEVEISRRLVVIGGGWIAAILVLSNDLWFPRYLLPATPPLILAATRLARLSHPALKPAITGLFVWFLVAAIRFDIIAATSPEATPWPEDDREQYVTGFSSGYGLRETAAWLEGTAQAEGPIVVIRDGGVTALHEGLDAWIQDPRITFESISPFRVDALGRGTPDRRRVPSFAVFEAGPGADLGRFAGTLVARFEKPGGASIVLLRLSPTSAP
jgi:hypothetical protein